MRKTTCVITLLATLLVAPHFATAQDEPEEATEEVDDAASSDDVESTDEETDADASAVDAPTDTATSGEKATRRAPGASTDFRIVYTPPGCMDSDGHSSLSLAEALERHFDINNGRIEQTSFGPAAFSNGPETIFPATNANDGALLDRLAEEDALEWTVVEEDFPALVSPWETLVQVPFRGHFDWLSIVESRTEPSGEFPDTERVTGTLSSASLSNGAQLYRLDLPDREQDSVFLRRPTATYQIDAPDDSVQIVALGESLGRGSRLKPVVLDRLADEGADSSIVLYPGDVASAEDPPELRALCGQTAKSLNPMALVPRSGELSMGVDGLASFAGDHGLRYVAANLVSRESGERPFRRFSILNLDGLTIAVIGIVGADQLEALPEALRDRWRLTDAADALASARRDLETQLQRRPDLTVVLLSTENGAEYSAVSSVPEVDVVIGPFDRADLVPFEESIDVEPGDFRRRRASVRVGGNPLAIGEIVANFGSDGLVLRPERFVHTVTPVVDSGPLDAALHRSFLPFEKARAARWSQPILPDLVPIFRTSEDIASEARIGDEEPLGYTEPIWSRLVANEVRRGFDADVAIVTRYERPNSLAGAITVGQLETWLDPVTQVRVVELSGRELRAIADYLGSGRAAGEREADFAGYAPGEALVEGRPLRDHLPYRVAIASDLASRNDLDGVLGDKSFTTRFEPVGNGWRPSDDGLPVTVRRAVLHSVGEDVVEAPELRDRLRDPALRRDSQWRLHLRDLSVRGIYSNNFGGQDYSETRETAVRVPDALQLGYRADVALTYDGPLLAWDLRGFAQFDRLQFGEPESTFEPFDEILASTELRANHFGFTIGDSDFPLIPALAVHYDTEATPLPDATDPGSDLARQQLARINPLLVAFPGDFLRRADLGPVVQLDLVDGRADVGLEASYRVVFPIAGALRFESMSSLRYLFGGSDDPADLALRFDSRNAFVHPIAGGFGLALYGDVYLVQGKTDANDGIGGLITAGAALRYDGSFRF